MAAKSFAQSALNSRRVAVRQPRLRINKESDSAKQLHGSLRQD